MERFRRLLPPSPERFGAREIAAEIAPPEGAGRRPFTLVNMIATVDGRATIDGRTSPIANRADYELFHALRARADAILVGAGTVRVEGYGRLVPEAATRRAREREGRRPVPLGVVVSRSLELPLARGLLADPQNEVVLITPSTDAELGPCAASVRYVRELDLRTALSRLGSEHGVRCIVCEGGPDLNATLFAAGLVDELHLVLASKLAGGRDPLTILGGDALDPPLNLGLRSLHESGGYLFARYEVHR